MQWGTCEHAVRSNDDRLLSSLDLDFFNQRKDTITDASARSGSLCRTFGFQ
jgi:hypothetical protein